MFFSFRLGAFDISFPHFVFPIWDVPYSCSSAQPVESFTHLNSIDIVAIQGKMRIVTAVKGCHQGALDVAVAQAERVSEFVSGDLKEVGAAVALDGPPFGVVEVGIAAVHGEVSVRQGATWSVERITVSVFAYLKSDFDVHLKRSLQF